MYNKYRMSIRNKKKAVLKMPERVRDESKSKNVKISYPLIPVKQKQAHKMRDFAMQHINTRSTLKSLHNIFFQ